MHLNRVYIKNYRSIQELDLNLQPGKNVLVGRNNSGKSNIVNAMDLVLGEASPDFKKSDSITENDFYSARSAGAQPDAATVANEMFIWCELTRTAGEAIDYDELYKCYGFYVCKESRYGPSRRFDLNSISVSYSAAFDVSEEEAEKMYVNTKYRDRSPLENEINAMYQFAFGFRARRSPTGIEKELRLFFRENSTYHWVMAFKASIRNALLQSAVIPSFRDPQSQLRITPWSWYGKLLQHLTRGCSELPAIREALNRLEESARGVFAEAERRISESAISVAFPGTQISFKFAGDKKTELHRNCVIYVDDGYRSLLTEKGAGIQSVTIIGLFNYYTREVNTIGSALLLVEEPELYLHPHARRVLSDKLDEFLDSNRNQVILTTHSVEFLRYIKGDLNVVLVQKREMGGTVAKGVSLRQFRLLLRDNNQNELFFADKVIVCEGFDEYLLRAASQELFPGKIDERNVSIIAVNGKDNMCKLVRLILELGLECFILSDFDFLLRDKGDERNAHGAKAHDSVCSLPAQFFQQPSILSTEGDAVYRALQSWRSKVKRDKQAAFYTAKTTDGLAIAELPGVLSLMRSVGIGILDGEIENLSLDQTFVSPTNKFDLDKVFRIRERITSGERLSTIFNLVPLKEVLSKIFNGTPTDPTVGQQILRGLA